MSRIIEGLRAARGRIKPEGFAFSAACTWISPTVVVPVYGALTYTAHEAHTSVDAHAFVIGAIAVLGIANAISIAAATKALEEEGYNSSVVASTLQVATGNPLLSATLSHASSYAQLLVANPVNSAALLGANFDLLTESMGATSLTLAAWFAATNALVLTGKTKEFTERVMATKKYIAERIIPARRK